MRKYYDLNAGECTNPFILCVILMRDTRDWSLSQLTKGERRGTPWSSRQFNTAHIETNIHTFGQKEAGVRSEKGPRFKPGGEVLTSMLFIVTLWIPGENLSIQ